MPDAVLPPLSSARPDAAAVAALARQTRSSHELVKDLYDQEIAALHAQAKVKNFIGIIASRRVKQRLRAQQKGEAGSKQPSTSSAAA
jgi:Protein of unknown function (DUF3562)